MMGERLESVDPHWNVRGEGGFLGSIWRWCHESWGSKSD